MSPPSHAQIIDRVVAASPAYRCAWRAFSAWCEARGEPPLPASADTLLAYLTHRRDVEHRAASTLEVAAYAVIKVHTSAGLPSPASPSLRRAIHAARRITPRPTSAARDEVRAIAAACGDDLAGLRDRALLLAIHHARLTRVGAVRLDVDHLDHPALAALRLRDADPLICPAAAVDRWLAARGNPQAGPLFVSVHAPHLGGRLSPVDVYRVLRLRCDAAGVRRLSAPALRAGGEG